MGTESVKFTLNVASSKKDGVNGDAANKTLSHGPSTSSLQMEKKQQCRPLEVVGLGVVIVLTLSLFLLPFILFYFPKDTISQDQHTTSASNHSAAETQLNETLECREDFFREESTGLCVPDCYSGRSWDVSPVTLAVNIITGVAIVIGVGAAVIFLILSFFKFKKVFVFPFILSIYIVFGILLLTLLDVVQVLAEVSLLCPSHNFLIALIRPTPFCVINGMLFLYLIFQIGCWWFFHVVAFFWKLQYPFHAFRVEKLGRIKHIHIGCIVAGLILPLIPILIIVADYSIKLETDEFLRSENATFASGGLGICGFINGEAVLFGFILPLSILTAVGTTLLVFILRNIHKVAASTNTAKGFGTIGVIVIVSFCYYVVMGVITLTTFAVRIRNVPILREELIIYFTCEQDGHDVNNPCDISSYHSIQNHSVIMSFLGYILLTLYPIFHLVYILNIEGLRKKCKYCCCYYCSRKRSKEMFSRQDTVMSVLAL